MARRKKIDWRVVVVSLIVEIVILLIPKIGDWILKMIIGLKTAIAGGK